MECNCRDLVRHFRFQQERYSPGYYGQETVAFGDAGYQGIEKRPDAKAEVTWHVAMRPGKRKALNKENEVDAMIDKAEKLEAGIRAKVEHPFRVVKRQFGFAGSICFPCQK